MKDKSTMLPGLMLFACFILLTVCSLGFDFAFSSAPALQERPFLAVPPGKAPRSSRNHHFLYSKTPAHHVPHGT